MDIKLIQSGRIAQYGITLGGLLYAAWRGLVWFLVPGDVGRRTTGAACDATPAISASSSATGSWSSRST
jgi:hypothetical protein